MGSLARKVKKNNESWSIKTLFGKEPKHRCKDCHKMTLYNKKGVCVYCSGEYKEVEEEFINELKKRKIKPNKEVKNETKSQ